MQGLNYARCVNMLIYKTKTRASELKGSATPKRERERVMLPKSLNE